MRGESTLVNLVKKKIGRKAKKKISKILKKKQACNSRPMSWDQDKLVEKKT